MTSEVLKFPHRRSHVIKSLLKTAKRLKDTSPEGCIGLQTHALALMALELKKARYAAERALEEMLD